MAITYPLALPTATGLTSMIVTPVSLVAVTESPWTGYQQTQANQGQRWVFDVSLPLMARQEASAWESFFLKLNGRQGTFLMGHAGEIAPRGVATGTPVVDGAGQTGQTLNTKGWTVSTTNIIKAGSWLQLGTAGLSRLYRVLEDANSDGAGKAALTIWPKITQGNIQADNAAIILSSAVGAFRMLDESVPFNVDTALHYNYKFSASSIV